MSEANFEERAIELAERLERITANAAPELADIALESARLGALSEIISIASGFLIGLALLGVAFWLIRKSRGVSSHDQEMYGFGVFIFGLAGGFTSFATFAHLSDPILWVSLSKPELWVAKQVLGL